MSKRRGWMLQEAGEEEEAEQEGGIVEGRDL